MGVFLLGKGLFKKFSDSDIPDAFLSVDNVDIIK